VGLAGMVAGGLLTHGFTVPGMSHVSFPSVAVVIMAGLFVGR
jgi:hypothetical protein